MSNKESEQDASILALQKGQAEILELLKPISETYVTVARLGKWLSAFLVLVSICIGIMLGLKEINK